MNKIYRLDLLYLFAHVKTKIIMKYTCIKRYFTNFLWQLYIKVCDCKCLWFRLKSSSPVAKINQSVLCSRETLFSWFLPYQNRRYCILIPIVYSLNNSYHNLCDFLKFVRVSKWISLFPIPTLQIYTADCSSSEHLYSEISFFNLSSLLFFCSGF